MGPNLKKNAGKNMTEPHLPRSQPVEEKTAAAVSDDAKDDATFFKVLDRVDIEGHVLDVSFVQKTVVVLSCVASEGANTNDTVKYTGDQGWTKS